MIKIILEEPVAIMPNSDIKQHGGNPDIDSFWIYKNPTQDEVDDLYRFTDNINILIKNNDYYIANSYYYTHQMMSRYLQSITKVKYDYYDYYLRVERKNNRVMSNSMINDKVFLTRLIPDMISVGLFNADFYIYFFRDHGKYKIKDFI